MLEEPIHDGADVNRLREALDPGAEAADPSDVQQDFDSGLARLVQAHKPSTPVWRLLIMLQMPDASEGLKPLDGLRAKSLHYNHLEIQAPVAQQDRASVS